MSIEIKVSKKLIPYKKAIEFLKKRVESIKNSKETDLLWILEHPTTYTAGIRAESKDILDKKIKVVNTNRGGKITLHNPGQKIIYFAIDLNKRKRDIRRFVNIIEKSIIEFLSKYKIKAVSDRKNIGIWVKNRKIAAIGIRVTKWVAYHGCSININNDLKKYQKIIPCGLDNNEVTSIYQEKSKVFKNVDRDLKEIFLRNIKEI
tara:strand:+ start:415 stop:1026 length:612 start_codon:yes stop_codon:yes gene_type:complete